MKALPQRSHQNIGSCWLRSRGWNPSMATGAGTGGMEDTGSSFGVAGAVNSGAAMDNSVDSGDAMGRRPVPGGAALGKNSVHGGAAMGKNRVNRGVVLGKYPVNGGVTLGNYSMHGGSVMGKNLVKGGVEVGGCSVNGGVSMEGGPENSGAAVVCCHVNSSSELGSNPVIGGDMVICHQGGMEGYVSDLSDALVPWLPDELHPYIESSHPALLGNTVNALMKDGMVEWDEEVIKDVLSDMDQKLVWKVPLSNHSRSDSWYWLQEDSGLFTVKSAYSLLQAAKTSSNVLNNSGFWRQLWQLKLPPKVVNFLWRVSTNSLPTRFQLSTKYIPIDPRCPFCLAAPETALHVLVRCSFAQSCWRRSHVPSVAPGAMVFTSWFEGGLKAWNVAESLEAAMILWSIWKHRNELEQACRGC
ncbi:hypothetical protein F8388_016885 [Cannabis sativa]|uniref:Reverse transcriptase zinc-binding domain-containing protein n=1 Tax=Cannabis sativa TaxID=3483 RepID=A0A7J6ES28_CANSA|nr:hypothetical protein F8388_016885 [Cannabis sativa]